MPEQYFPEKSQTELSTTEAKFAIKFLETVIPKIGESEKLAAKQRAIYLRRVFQSSIVSDLLKERNIHEEEEPEVLKEKLEALLKELKVESKRQIFYPIENEAPNIPSSVPEGAEEKMTSVLDTLNGLYKERQGNDDYVEKERPRIEEAMGQLAVFGSDIDENEVVEVVRTPDGSLEVIFERDMEEANKLREISTDIRLSRERIVEYEKSIEKKKGGEGGFLQKIFSRKKEIEATENDPLDALSVEELEGKRARTQQALLEVIQDYQAREEELQVRKEKKKRALDIPLTVTGIEVFTGSWKEFSGMLKKGCEDALARLENSLSQYDEQIAALEAERESLEKKAA